MVFLFDSFGNDFAINSFNSQVFLWAPTVTVLLFLATQWICKVSFVVDLGRIVGRNTLALMGYNITFNIMADFVGLSVGTWWRAIFVVSLGIVLALLLYKFPAVKRYIQ